MSSTPSAPPPPVVSHGTAPGTIQRIFNALFQTNAGFRAAIAAELPSTTTPLLDPLVIPDPPFQVSQRVLYTKAEPPLPVSIIVVDASNPCSVIYSVIDPYGRSMIGQH